MSASLQALRIVVRGRVQGVSFRAFLARAANDLDLVGWTRNVGLDEVETVVAGDERALAQFRDFARRGPPAARVDDYLEEWVATPHLGLDFVIAPSI